MEDPPRPLDYARPARRKRTVPSRETLVMIVVGSVAAVLLFWWALSRLDPGA
jgi:hypothetical protein